MQNVYRAVRTEYLNTFQVKCIFSGVKHCLILPRRKIKCLN